MKRFLYIFLFISFSVVSYTQNTVSFVDTAIAHSEGLGLNVSIRSYPSWDFSGLMSNYIPRSTLEHNLDKTDVWKRTGCAWAPYTDNPFQGKQSAMINSWGTDASPAIVKCQTGYNMFYRSGYQYELSFALKKGDDFNSPFSVKFGAMLETTKQDADSDWQVYTYYFEGNNSSGQAFELKLYGAGYVYLDDVQLHRLPDKRGDKYSSDMMKLLRDLRPATIRWGALTANVYSLEGNPGGNHEFSIGDPYSNYTIADFVNLCNELGIYSNITIGTASYTDYFKDPSTMKRFVDYLGAGSENPSGAVRKAEGYDELLSASKGIILEFGNEVWGSDSHNAPFAGASDYGKWTGPLVDNMISSDFYDNDKFLLTFSGRDISDSGGWSKEVIDNAPHNPDWMAVSGYMGGNFDYDPSIPFESELNYYQSGFAYIESQKAGVANFRKAMFQKYLKAYPLFLYEGNMTNSNPDYYGKFGQAVSYIDFCASMIASGGVTIPVIFNMNQSQWRIINNDRFDYKPLPLYYAAMLFNRYCTGNVLKSSWNGETITGTFSREYTYPAVSSYVFNDSTRYSVLLVNRDFENGRDVTLDLPGAGISDTARIAMLSAADWNVTEPTGVVLTENTVSGFANGYTLNLPPFSMAIVSFMGEDSGIDVPLGYYRHIHADSVDIFEKSGIDSITKNKGLVYLAAKVYPVDCTIPYYDMRIIEGESTAVPGSFSEVSGRLSASGTVEGNGIIKVEAVSKDDPGVRDTISIVVVNQGTEGIGCTGNEKISIYPNPAADRVFIHYPGSGFRAGVRIYDLTGRTMYHRKGISNNQVLEVDVSKWERGVYTGLYSDGRTSIPFRIVVAGE
ncbi:MAG TPA: T9SS type A sorting domain-containing protein [Bacteroidales bacterium]|nr:T9SS type A sorting domain-containing protein [Bacteroidales bacterium]